MSSCVTVEGYLLVSGQEDLDNPMQFSHQLIFKLVYRYFSNIKLLLLIFWYLSLSFFLLKEKSKPTLVSSSYLLIFHNEYFSRFLAMQFLDIQ